MTRYLDQDGFGAYTTINAFLQFFGILVDMGLSVVAIQLISEVGHDHKKNFNNIFTMRVLTGILIYGLAPLIVLAFPYSRDIKFGVLLMAPSFFLSSLIQLSTAIYQVEIKMMVPIVADLISKVFLIIGIIAATTLHWGLAGILAVILANNIVQWLVLFVWSWKWVIPNLSFDFAIWKQVFLRAWPIALSILCNIVYLRADTIILSLFRSQTEVGIYGAAFRVVDVLMTFPIMFIGLTLGSFAHAWSSHDHVRFARYFQKTFDFMCLTAFPLIVGTIFTGTSVMVLVAGSSFMQSGILLKLLIIAIGSIFFGTLFGNLINIIGEQKKMLLGYFCVALIALCAYLFFIPRYGYWAAASITIATEIMIALIGFGIFFAKTRVLPKLWYCGKTIAASSVMAIFLYAFPHANLLIKIFGACIAYGAALYIVGGVTKDMTGTFFPFFKKLKLG